MRVTICGPNLNDQTQGEFHVHAAGCADLANRANREPEYRNGWTIDATTADDVAEAVYADMLDEGSMTLADARADIHFFGCTELNA